MVSIELDRARRRFHEAQNDLRNTLAFIERWDGDPDKANSLAIKRQQLPGMKRRAADAQAALAPLEASHREVQVSRSHTSFVFRERTTPLAEGEEFPELPAFLRRTA